TQAGLSVLFGAAYLLTLLGNGLIILLVSWTPASTRPCTSSSAASPLWGSPDAGALPPGDEDHLLHPVWNPALLLPGPEFLLLAAMAYDRYVAICDPLLYVAVMRPRLCAGLAVVSWLVSLANASVETVVTVHLPTCGHHVLNHVGLRGHHPQPGVLLVPCCLVALSYTHIVATILRIRSSGGHRKAFGTCASHFTVVSMPYRPALGQVDAGWALCPVWGRLSADPAGQRAHHPPGQLDARLHPSMYFFLGSLSIMLVCFLLETKTISFTQCGAQLFLSLALEGTEFPLLIAMAYDHYMVGDPLHYMAAVSPRLIVVSWLVGMANFVVEMAITTHLPSCGHHVLNHVACVDVTHTRVSWWTLVELCCWCLELNAG
ncbi:hypothetical protein EI555_014319, partial [Monodon monoceros]